MAKKDPAFLFYASDFLTGTMFMTNEQVGIYIRLLCSQHQHGGLIDKISFMSMVGSHEVVKVKFIEGETGFYNIRLMEEMQLRNVKSTNISKAAFDTWEKRKNTIVPKKDTIVIQSQKDSNTKVKKKSTKVIRPEDINEVINYFIENGYRKDVAEKVYRYYSETDWHDSKGNKVLNWKQKCQAVWFKDENKIPVVKAGEIPYDQMTFEQQKEKRKRDFQDNL
jgi:uncharacterized protein YdaU (DUF1376 family)